MSTSILHISIPTTYHVNQKFKDPFQIYRAILKSYKIESSLNYNKVLNNQIVLYNHPCAHNINTIILCTNISST